MTGPGQHTAISTRRSALRFTAATGLSFGVNLGLTAALHEWFGVAEETAFGVALAVVFLMNFAMLRWWIYGRRPGSLAWEFAGYSVSALAFRGAEYLAFLLVHTWLNVHYTAAILGIQAVSFVSKYVYYGAVIFRRPAAPPRECRPPKARVL
jgi:putative flippase GtrA